MVTLRLCVVIVALAVLTVRPASADPLQPSQVVRVTFDFASSQPFPANIGVPDFLRFQINTAIQQPFGAYQVALFDGRQLLGTWSTSVNGLICCGGLTLFAQFAAPGADVSSLAPFSPPTEVDFSSIRDRSMSGILELSIFSGLVDVNLNSADVGIFHAIGNHGAQGNTFAQPTIRSTEIAPASTPEPASLLLFGTGVAAMIARRWVSGNEQGARGRLVKS
jgi:hypothetical protein